MPTPPATITAARTLTTTSSPILGCFFLALGRFFIEREAT